MRWGIGSGKSRMVYVKTVYESKHYIAQDISVYRTEEEAKNFIDACLRWGIGIASCSIVPTPHASCIA